MPKIFVPKGILIPNNDPPHIKRLKSIGKWYLPKEGTSEWVDFRLRSASSQQSPAYRKTLKELAKKSSATAEACLKNGAGLPADMGVREFGSEYNRRVGQHGLHYLPSSFNLFEAFFEYNPKYALFIPLNEKDHICSVGNFLDYLATIASSNEVSSKNELMVLEEDVIYNYSFTDKVGEWLVGDGEECFSIASASIVRRGNEVTIVSLAGMRATLGVETEKIIQGLQTIKQNPDKPDLVPDIELKPEAVKFDENGNYWRCYLGVRFNLDSSSIDSRYLITDNGNSWSIQSDDPLTVDGLKEISSDEVADKYIKRIEKYNHVFVYMVRFLRLNSYFSDNKACVAEDKSITELAELSGSIRGKRTLENMLSSQKIYDRKVFSLAPSSSDNSGVILPPLELKVETEGYWEKLQFGTYGEGPDGERVLGRTWVRRTLSSRQSRIKAGVNLFQNTHTSEINGEKDEGFIYALRNASHQIDIFKIGLTRRSVDLRATEISRGTGVPDQFLVVQYWWVPDVVYAEKRIHALLDNYRLRDQREFFRAEYTTIRATIDLVVSELSGRLIK